MKDGVEISLLRKPLLQYTEFERWLYYHAYGLCRNQGSTSPSHDDVNIMLSTKPYGNSGLCPQHRISQIVDEIGMRQYKAWRIYFCELALRRNRKCQSETS